MFPFSPPGSHERFRPSQCRQHISLAAAGSVSTAFLPELPPGATEFEGTFTGSISAPSAVLTLPGGFVNYMGLTIGISADTILADMTGCSLVNFQARTGSSSLSLSGEAGFSELNWEGTLLLSLQDTDLSSYFPRSAPNGHYRQGERLCRGGGRVSRLCGCSG